MSDLVDDAALEDDIEDEQVDNGAAAAAATAGDAEDDAQAADRVFSGSFVRALSSCVPPVISVSA